MDYALPIQILIGLALLFLGRKLFWLFVAAVGFVIAMELVPRYLGNLDPLVGIGAALLVGLIGAGLAVVLQRVAVAIAGFLLGLVFVFQLHDVWSLPLEGVALWAAGLIGGLVGVALVVALFDVALIVLSSIAGAQMLLASLETPLLIRSVAFLLLLVVGMLVQGRSLRRATRAGY